MSSRDSQRAGAAWHRNGGDDACPNPDGDPDLDAPADGDRNAAGDLHPDGDAAPGERGDGHHEILLWWATAPTTCGFGAQRVAMQDDSGTYYLHADHLGSTGVVVDEAGAVVSWQSYAPFGSVRAGEGAAPTDYGYTGQRYDAGSALLYYGARYFDPLLGRFAQADTIVPGAGNPQAFNRYSYTLNNPIKYTDPSGHMQVCEDPSCGYQAEPIPTTTPEPELSGVEYCLKYPFSSGCVAPLLPPATSGSDQNPDQDAQEECNLAKCEAESAPSVYYYDPLVEYAMIRAMKSKTALPFLYFLRAYKVNIVYGGPADTLGMGGLTIGNFIYYPASFLKGIPSDYLVHEVVHVFQGATRGLYSSLEREREAYTFSYKVKNELGDVTSELSTVGADVVEGVYTVNVSWTDSEYRKWAGKLEPNKQFSIYRLYPIHDTDNWLQYLQSLFQ